MAGTRHYTYKALIGLDISMYGPAVPDPRPSTNRRAREHTHQHRGDRRRKSWLARRGGVASAAGIAAVALLASSLVTIAATPAAASAVRLPPASVQGVCDSGTVPVVVASDAAAQSDIYSAVTLAGSLGDACVVLAGTRGEVMPADQQARLDAAAAGGYVVGGLASVPDGKIAGRTMARLGGADRWETALLVGSEAADPGSATTTTVPSSTQFVPTPGSSPGNAATRVQVPPASVLGECDSGTTPIVVASDLAAQSDIYSAVTLAGVLGDACIVLAGPRGEAMSHDQQARLDSAAGGGYVVGGLAAVPDAKIAGRTMTRLAGADRWETALLVGSEAAELGDSTEQTDRGAERRDDGNPPGGGDTPGGNDNPPPPTLTVIPPEEEEEEEFSSQVAAGTPEVVRAITDKSVHTNFQAYYPLTGTIVDPDGQTLSWNVIKPAEADWLVFDSAALTLAGRVPSSFAKGDSITITVKAIDTDAKAAEYSFSITSLGPYNPEPLGCRATGAPIATKSWIKIGNWEWAEPNHNPAIPRNTPGYWQPDWVENLGGVGKPKWSAPYIIKPSRRVAGQAERWRMKEVEYYRITRSPAWDFGQLIVDIDDLQRFYGPDGNEVAITVVKGRDIAPTSTDPRTDGLWTYTLTDYEQESTEPGYIYTIEASTCENGPWSRPLELQWRFPNAPTIRPEFTYLTRYGEDGNLLPDNDLALNLGWRYERGEFYEVNVDILDSEGNSLLQSVRWEYYGHLSQPGSSWVERLRLTYLFDNIHDDNLAGSGKQIRVRLRVGKDVGLLNRAPVSRDTVLILSTNNYRGPPVAND